LIDRFFCPDPPESGRIVLAGDEAHHLARVRRLGPEARVEVFDGSSPDAWPAAVREVGQRSVTLEVLGDPVPGREPGRHVTLAVAAPKGERLDWLVEKAVEVGVGVLIPLHSARSVVDPRPAKLERLRRTVIEASKQCGRNRLMAIWEAASFAECVRMFETAARLFAHPGGRAPRDWPLGAPGTPIAILVGPEGGFTEAEAAAAIAEGWIAAGLGPTILRVETAAVVAAALAQGMT
jgi:16S rRNA (uracil1498-N3)-methyltransferase